MSDQYGVKNVKIKAVADHVLITDMHLGEVTTAGGIVLRSDDGKRHGIRARWGKVYDVGPDQKTFKKGQWVLLPHGRWSRKFLIDDGDGVKEIQRVDVKDIMLISEGKPDTDWFNLRGDGD